MKKRTLKIGIASKDEIHQRMIDIASGKYRVKPYEPKIWFTSKSSLAQALNNKNHILFNMIKN
jgi:predicted transcriptional regulator